MPAKLAKHIEPIAVQPEIRTVLQYLNFYESDIKSGFLNAC